MIDIGILVSGIGLAQSFAELMGLIETLEAKIDKLSQSELDAGMRNLDQACQSKVEAESLIREARGCFNKAIGLELGYRQGVAYLGLALCHSYLHDQENCIRALRELVGLTPKVSFAKEVGAKIMADCEEQSIPKAMLKEYLEAFPVGGLRNLRRLATVAARRARYTPEAIRELAQPRREEIIYGIRSDTEALSLVRIQLLVSNYLGETVGWMGKHGINSKDIGLDASGAKPSDSPNPTNAADA